MTIDSLLAFEVEESQVFLLLQNWVYRPIGLISQVVRVEDAQWYAPIVKTSWQLKNQWWNKRIDIVLFAWVSDFDWYVNLSCELPDKWNMLLEWDTRCGLEVHIHILQSIDFTSIFRQVYWNSSLCSVSKLVAFITCHIHQWLSFELISWGNLGY